MTQAFTPPSTVVTAGRLNRQTWALRGLGGLLLVFASAYVTLPWWLPADFIRTRLELQLSEDFGTPVQIANLRAGWLEGVVVEGITVADSTPDDGPLARIGRIRLDLSPFTLLLDEKVRLLEITDPHLWLHIDESGQLRLPQFDDRKSPRLPSFNYLVRGLTCHVLTPGVRQSFRVDRLDLQLDPPSGLLHLSSVTRVRRPRPDEDEPTIGRLDFDANIRIPRLKKSEPLNGNMEVEWTDLAVNDLPVPLISHVPVEQVDGTTSGRFSVETRPETGINYTVSIVFNGVSIMRPELDRPAKVPDAEFVCSGQWDPGIGFVVLNDLQWETPALQIATADSRLPAVYIEEKSDTPLEIHLRGSIKDWSSLQEEIPEIAQLTDQLGVELRGGARFTAMFKRGLREDHARLWVDGRESQWRLHRGSEDYLNAEVGLGKELRFELIRERSTGHLLQPVFSLVLGDVEWQASGELSLPQDDIAEGGSDSSLLSHPFLRALSTLRGRTRLRCGDMANLERLIPPLEDLAELKALSGPLEVSASIEPAGPVSKAGFELMMPAESALVWTDVFQKAPGHPLELRAEAQLPHAPRGQIDLLNMDLHHGAGRASLESSHGSFEYRMDLQGLPGNPMLADAEGTWHVGLQLERLERLVELSPLAKRTLNELGVTFLTGGLELDADIGLAYQPNDWLLTHQIHIIADSIAARCRDVFTKTGGEPLTIDLTHRLRRLADESDHYWAANLVQPAGSFAGSLLLSGSNSSDPADRFEWLELRADIEEVAEYLHLLPHQQMGFAASGSLAAEFQQRRLGTSCTGRLSFDGTHAHLAGPRGLNVQKKSGVPLSGDFTWHVEADSVDPKSRTWSILDGRIRLANAVIDKLQARATIHQSEENPMAFSGDDLTRAECQLAGSVVFDEQLESLHPALRDVLRDASLGGRVGWTAALELGSEALLVEGDVDGTDLSLRTTINSDELTTIEKSTQDPLSVSWMATLPRSALPLEYSEKAGDTETIEIEVHQATANIGGNVLSASGVLDFAPDQAVGASAVSIASLNISAILPHLETLHRMAPNAPLETLQGSLNTELSLTGLDGTLQLIGGRAELSRIELGPTARPLHLDGSAELQSSQSINLEQLDWQWGESGGTVSGTLAKVGEVYDAQLGVGGREVKIENLRDCVHELMAGFAPARPPAQASAATRQQARQIIDLLRRTRAVVDGHVDTLLTPLPLEIKALADAGWQRLEIQHGDIKMSFGCLVDGGCVDGQLTADLNAPDPTYRLTYTADRIQPGRVVDAYLRRTFPGMVASGPLTLIDESVQKLLPAPGEPNFEVGKGRLIIEGGVVSGRAAPEWMARYFPGLNLASYEFTRMHSWFDKSADGRVQHQMLYTGAFYNVYMIGWSNPEGFFEYEVGIDFLAGLESEYWANSGQGRVPLFTKTGQVRPDGSLADETVSFVSLRRVLETLFVRNNPVITAYHAVRKRVLGQQ